MAAKGKVMNKWLCNEGNPVTYWCTKRGLEQEMILFLSSVLIDARKGKPYVAKTSPAFGT